MSCPECCWYCDKDKKTCEDFKERRRAMKREIYRAKKKRTDEVKSR